MSLEEMIAKNQLLVSEASLQKLKFERQQSVLNASIYNAHVQRCQNLNQLQGELLQHPCCNALL